MGSGIVSIDLYADHQPVLSAIMLWFAAGAWLLLTVVLGGLLASQRDRFAREARSPVSFTSVAGTAVLGTRLAMQGWHVAAAALLAVSGAGWALLLIPVLRRWKTPTAGISFVLSVATEGLAVLGATLAVSYRAGWLLGAAVPALFLGLAFYVFTAARFDLRELLTERGDHWIAGGALAISALAAGKIIEAAATPGSSAGSTRRPSSAPWRSGAWPWCGSCRRSAARSSGPGSATTYAAGPPFFPLGMYAACSFAAARDRA